MSCGVGCKHGSDLVLLWLWCRSAAVALIGPLAWEPSYAAGTALKSQNKKKRGLVDVYTPLNKHEGFYYYYYYYSSRKRHRLRKAWALESGRLGLGFPAAPELQLSVHKWGMLVVTRMK